MPPKLETRFDRCEVRTMDVAVVEATDEERAAGSLGKTLEGYAVVWDSLSVPMMGFREKFSPGAFKANLKGKPDVKALVDHDPSKLLGRTTSGSLSVEEDDKGLLMRLSVPDTTLGRDTVTLVERGDLSQMSFAFYTKKDEWEQTDEGEIRTVTEAELRDVSLVTYPAYPETSVQVRSGEVSVGLDMDVVMRCIARRNIGLGCVPGEWRTMSMFLESVNALFGKPETSVQVRSMLLDHGVDVEVVARCLGRRRLGLDLKPDDKVALRQSMMTIQQMCEDDEAADDEVRYVTQAMSMMLNRRELLDARIKAGQ